MVMEGVGRCNQPHELAITVYIHVRGGHYWRPGCVYAVRVRYLDNIDVDDKVRVLEVYNV